MRLIDADALIEIITARMGYQLEHAKNSPYVNCARDMMKLVKHAPTIEAEPVKHGHWIDKPTGKYGNWQSYCSACGRHSQIGGIESNRHKPRCPWCGAFMDEVTT